MRLRLAVAARETEEEQLRWHARQRRSCSGVATGLRWKAVVRCGYERGRRHAAGENTATRQSSGLGHDGGMAEQRARAWRRPDAVEQRPVRV
jgi:hypothetical protein